MFTVRDRDRVRDRILQLAESDGRVVAGAVVGSLAHSSGDRWSDLDLTFAVVDSVPVAQVLDDWSRTLGDECAAVRLFDLPSEGALYRVFLLPGCLQVDVSVSPADQFGARGPNFRLLFWCGGRDAGSRSATCRRAVRVRRPPSPSGEVLHRARSLLAGRVLD